VGNATDRLRPGGTGGACFYAYIHDRISQANRMPSLASVIAERAKHLKLASSWDTA